jgi:hypothetical protein
MTTIQLANWKQFVDGYERILLNSMRLFKNLTPAVLDQIEYTNDVYHHIRHHMKYFDICSYNIRQIEATPDTYLCRLTTHGDYIGAIYINHLQIGDIIEIEVNGNNVCEIPINHPEKIVTLIDKIYCTSWSGMPVYIILKRDGGPIPFTAKMITISPSSSYAELTKKITNKFVINHSSTFYSDGRKIILYDGIYCMKYYGCQDNVPPPPNPSLKDLRGYYGSNYFRKNLDIFAADLPANFSSYTYDDQGIIGEYCVFVATHPLPIDSHVISNAAIFYKNIPVGLIIKLQRAWREYYYSPGNLGAIRAQIDFQRKIKTDE